MATARTWQEKSNRSWVLGAAGFASATLWVLETNTRAIRFYTRLGWQPDGAVRDEVVGGAAIRDVGYRRELRAQG
ncbi:N-acetyltransferase [Parafrankia discariae]|uniref:N-acetyltransferase n=1 Tax=Parafrankia discariae TaxID=365528 RepID=UPI00047840BD|nr:N-acetyltransferase [Parafrankia discariae]